MSIFYGKTMVAGGSGSGAGGDYLPLAGGTMTGTITTEAETAVKKNSGDLKIGVGGYHLIVNDDGALRWNDKNVVRTINGVEADDSGEIDLSSSQTSFFVPNWKSAFDVTLSAKDSNGFLFSKNGYVLFFDKYDASNTEVYNTTGTIDDVEIYNSTNALSSGVHQMLVPCGIKDVVKVSGTYGSQFQVKAMYATQTQASYDIIGVYTDPGRTFVTLEPGEYRFVAVGGGGVDGYSNGNTSGGSGACIIGDLSVFAEQEFALSVGGSGTATSIGVGDDFGSGVGTVIFQAANGSVGYMDIYSMAHGGIGGSTTDCVISSSFTNVKKYGGFDGNSYEYATYGGNFANELYPYGGGAGKDGIHYNPQTGYIEIMKIS